MSWNKWVMGWSVIKICGRNDDRKNIIMGTMEIFLPQATLAVSLLDPMLPQWSWERILLSTIRELLHYLATFHFVLRLSNYDNIAMKFYLNQYNIYNNITLHLPQTAQHSNSKATMILIAFRIAHSHNLPHPIQPDIKLRPLILQFALRQVSNAKREFRC